MEFDIDKGSIVNMQHYLLVYVLLWDYLYEPVLAENVTIIGKLRRKWKIRVGNKIKIQQNGNEYHWKGTITDFLLKK